MKLARRIAVMLIASIVLSLAYLYVNTPIFFAENTAQPVQVFFSTSQGKQLGNGAVTEKYGGLKSVEFRIDSPFNEATAQDGSSRFRISFNNFTKEIDLWVPTGNGNEEEYNQTAENEYVSSHVPDYQINASFIEGAGLPIWSQVWESQPEVSVSTNAFLHQTSYGVWEGEYFFSSGFTGMRLQYNEREETYLQVTDETMTFRILVPNGYYIETPEQYTLTTETGGTLVTKTISSGNTFYLKVRDRSAPEVAAFVNFVFPMVVGIFLALVSEELWAKTKRRSKPPTKLVQQPSRKPRSRNGTLRTKPH